MLNNCKQQMEWVRKGVKKIKWDTIVSRVEFSGIPSCKLLSLLWEFPVGSLSVTDRWIGLGEYPLGNSGTWLSI